MLVAKVFIGVLSGAPLKCLSGQNVLNRIATTNVETLSKGLHDFYSDLFKWIDQNWC